jgi:hypothetical protein
MDVQLVRGLGPIGRQLHTRTAPELRQRLVDVLFVLALVILFLLFCIRSG